jgi:glutathione S-transferase
MKLYWCPQTRASRAAWMLEELGRPYERVRIDIRNEASRADPEFRAVSPMGKVPALVDGPVKLWDSGAICVYLADAYPDAGLGVPIGDPNRGAFLQWAMYNNSVIEPAMGEKFTGATVNTVQSGHGSFDQMIDVLIAGLRPGPWILGERFTLPDVLLGSSIHFMDMFKVLPDRAELKAYLERCRTRPAFQRAMSFDAAAAA